MANRRIVLNAGEVYGGMTIVREGKPQIRFRPASKRKDIIRMAWCICGRCGNGNLVRTKNLFSKNPPMTCGCNAKLPRKNRSLETYGTKAGDVFGKWTVIDPSVHSDIYRRWMARVRCKCGVEALHSLSQLVAGDTKGCIKCQTRRPPRFRKKTANPEKSTVEYRTWRNMHKRCYDRDLPRYDQYGGRGISVCKRWHEYYVFLADMGRRPEKMTSIDRIDVNGNYSPDNCRWATWKDQARNKTNTRWVDYKGQRISAAELADLLGISYAALISRIDRGWDELELQAPSGRWTGKRGQRDY